MDTETSIVFYFPFRGVGGVSITFLRLAEILKKKFKVFLADYSDGYMSRNLPDGINLICVDKEFAFPMNSIFIFQSFLPWRFPHVKKVMPGSRIMFWGLHPYNFDPKIFNYSHPNKFFAQMAKIINKLEYWRRAKLKKVIHYLLSRNSLYFLSRDLIEKTAELLDIKIDSEDFLTIPMPPATAIKKKEFTKNLHCAWIGRLCDFKYPILDHLIQRLAQASESLGSIKLMIIGDGEFTEYIKQQAGYFQTANFHCEFLGEMAEKDIPKFLADKVDILFAMGMSAIEGARVAIPVFITDFSYQRIKGNYRFEFITQKDGFCLGEEINQRHLEHESSLENSLQAIMQDYKAFSGKSFEYWQKNYSLESCSDNFIRAMASSQASFNEMIELGFFKSDMPGKIFRSVSYMFRKDLQKEKFGFRHDC